MALYRSPDYGTSLVNWPFGSGKVAQNTFSRWWPWWPAWISNQNNFSYF